nr:exonuclease domain-containing protein [Corynebacterium lactis]
MDVHTPNFSFPAGGNAESSLGFAVVDFETTGFTRFDRIIEIGVVLLGADLEVEGRWRTLVQPDRGFDNSQVHGITPSDLVEAPTFDQVARRFADVINGRALIAHNAGFERKFMEYEFGRLGVELPDGEWSIDTLKLARALYPGQPASLGHLLAHLGLNNVAAHTALADADATAQVFRHFVLKKGLFPGHAKPLVFTESQLSTVPESDAALLPRADGLFPGDAAESQSAGAGEPSGADTKWLRLLTEHVPSMGDAASDEYISYLVESMVDGRLDVRELSRLHGIAAVNGLGADDIEVLHEHYLRQLIVQAWSDGVVTEQERGRLVRIATELGISSDRVDFLIYSGSELRLHVGDRVTFTGAMVTPREVWEERARKAGLDVGGVIRRSAVVVAADVHTASNKAKKARALGIPIVDEVTFAHALSALVASQNKEQAQDQGRTQNPEQEQARTPQRADQNETGTQRDTSSQREATSRDSSGDFARDFAAVFPWLDSADVDDIREDVMSIARAWIDDHSAAGLGRLSPFMNFGVFPESPEWKRVLDKLGLSGPSVRDTSVRDLFDVKGYGRVRVQKLVVDAVTHAFDEFEASEGEGTGSPTDAVKDAFGQAAEGVRGILGKVFEDADGAVGEADTGSPAIDAEALVDWLAITGDAQALVGGAPDYLPESVRVQSQALGDRVAAVCTRAQHEIQAVMEQDTRFPAIANRRLVRGASLEELGQQCGVTRERIRQLESTLLASLADAGPACEMLRAGLFHRYAPVARLSRIRAEMPALFEVPSGMEASLIKLLVHTGSRGAGVSTAQWRIDGEWFLSHGFEERFSKTVEGSVDEYGVVPLSVLADALDISTELAAEWIGQRTQYRIFEGQVFTRVTSVSDRAVALLSYRGTPMHIDDIAEVMADRNSRAIDGRLALDPRTKRCAPGTWALAEWDMEEWTNIADYIGRRVDEAMEQGLDGASLDEVIAGAVGFGVAESSVRMYAATGEFAVEDGRVRRRSTEEYEPIDTAPEESKGLYWRGDHWALLLTITYDHVRGSGCAIPSGVAGMYGMSYGDEKFLPSRLGEQRIVVKNTNTHMSTISRFVRDMGLEEGERVWVHFGDSFDITRAPAAVPQAEGLAGLVNTFALEGRLGCEGAVEDAEFDAVEVLAALNEALGLPVDAPRRKTVARLRHRREDELAEKVREL